MAIRQLKDGRWICYYRERDPETGTSKERREYFGRGIEGQKKAQARHDALHLQKRRPARRHVGPVFADLARSYVQNQHLAKNTKEVLRYQLEAHIIPYFGHRDAIGLRFHDLDLYVKSRRVNVQDSTIRRELTAIQAILNFAVSRNPPLIPANPVRDYKKPKAYDAIIPPPSVDEVERILANSADHLRRAIVLSYYLGLRPGAVELLSLTWVAVSWESESILVASAHKGGPIKRVVPIHPGLLPILTTWYADDEGHGPIIHYHGKPIRSIKTAWRHALKEAKITRRLRPYDLRHAFATAALERDADIKALSEIMGSRPETLMRTYQHVSHRLRIDTVAKIPGLTICDQKPKKKAAPKSGLSP
jgi:integrase